MKKRINITIVLLYALITFISAIDVNAGTVNVNINGNSTVKLNDTISLTVNASDIIGFTDGLATIQGDISYDGGYLEYQSYKKADSSPLSASYGTTTKRFVALGMSGEYIQNAGDIITLTFKAKQLGKTTIGINNIVVGDTKAIVHDAKGNSKEIEIVADNPKQDNNSGNNSNKTNSNKKNNTTNKNTSTSSKTSSTSSSKSKDNNLESMTINNAKISPEFSSSVTNYNVTVPNGTKKLDLHYKTSSKSANVVIEGNNSLKSGTTNTVKIIVTAEDGSKKVYTLNVTISDDESSNKLSSLKVKESNLYPKFDSDINEYTIKLKKKSKKLTIDAVAKDKSSKVEIIDNKNLDKNNSVVLIKVTDKNGYSNYYKLKVNTSKSEVTIFGINIKYIIGSLLLLAILLLIIIIIFKKKDKKEDEEEPVDDLYDDVITKDELIGAINERDSKKLKMLLTQEEANKLKEEVRRANEKEDSINTKDELVRALRNKDTKRVNQILEKEKNTEKLNNKSYDELIKQELIDAIEKKDVDKIQRIIKSDKETR